MHTMYTDTHTHVCVNIHTQHCTHLLHVGFRVSEERENRGKHVLVQHILCLLVCPSDNVAQGSQSWGLQKKHA